METMSDPAASQSALDWSATIHQGRLLMFPVTSDAERRTLPLLISKLLVCSLAALVGFVFTVACFFPGYMSPDSISQLEQGRTMSFSAWHPPVMSFLWGLLDRIVPGPAGMLVFQNIMFWAGLSLFVYYLFERAGAATAIFLVGFCPPAFAQLSTIWKDVGMGCSFLLACGLLLSASRRSSKLAWGAAFIPLWYGLSIRHNAIIAVIPLAIWVAVISRQLFPGKGQSPQVSIALRAALLLAVLVVTSTGVNKLLASQPSAYPVQQILVHDLVGVSLETNTLYLPEYLTAELPTSEVGTLKRLYTPNEVVPLFCCDNNARFELTSDPTNLSRLWVKWRYTVAHHLRAYLSHRSRIFRSEFTIGRSTVCLPFWQGIDSNSLNVVFHSTPLNRSVMALLSKVQNGPLFWGWVYLVLLVVLLCMFWLGVSQDRVAALLMGLSGLLYALGYFFVSTTCDFRMHWWSVLTVFLLTLLALARKSKGARSQALA